MLEKALMIIMFMYAASFSVLGGQYVLGDVLGIDLTNSDGIVLESHLINFVDTTTLNSQQQSIVEANFTGNSTYYDPVETSTTSAAYVAWELVQLLTGTYIFNLLLILGVPQYFVTGMVFMYGFLLARAIIGYVRGI